MAWTDSRFGQWLDQRYKVTTAVEWSRHKTVPVYRGSVWYYFGGVTLFLFMMQVATGILLLLYYRVGVESSYESVRFIVTKVPFGWLIRSMHSWGANLMILTALIHLFSVMFERAYTKPRELTWISGFFMLLLAMGFGFSGYLLPWNKLSYFATKVGTEIVGVIPGVGGFLLRFLRGSEDVTGATLARFFGLHVAILPAIFVLFLAFHLVFIQVQGMSSPHLKTPPKKPPMPFFPNFVMRDALLWLLVLNLLALLAVYFPWELGEKADPFASAPAGIHPEWYFLAAFEMLRLLPSKFAGIDGELFGIFGLGIVVLIGMLLPAWDNKPGNGARKIVIAAIAAVVIVVFIVMTILGAKPA